MNIEWLKTALDAIGVTSKIASIQSVVPEDGYVFSARYFGLNTTGDLTSKFQTALDQLALIGTVGRPAILDLRGAEIDFTTVSVGSNLHVLGGRFKGGEIRGLNKSNIRFDDPVFYQSLFNGINLDTCSHVDIYRPRGDGAGLNGVIDTSLHGYFIRAISSDRIRVFNSPGMKECRGQGAIGYYNSRRCEAHFNTIFDTWLRGIHTYGNAVTTGDADLDASPLYHYFSGNRIYQTGRTNPSSSAVGQNAIYMAATKNDGSLDYDNHHAYDNRVWMLGENGIECLGGGRIKRNTIRKTNAYGKTTPSTEGVFLANFCDSSDNIVFDSAGPSFKTTNLPSDIHSVNDRAVRPGMEGFSSNNTGSTSSRIKEFRLEGFRVDSPKPGYAPVYIKDNSSGIRTWDRSCVYKSIADTNTVNAETVPIALQREYSDVQPTAGVRLRGDVVKNKFAAVGSAQGWVVVAPGTDIVSSGTATWTNGGYQITGVVVSSGPTPRVGDALAMNVASDADNNTIRRFVITSINGTTYGIDRPTYGGGGSVSWSTVTPTWASQPNL